MGENDNQLVRKIRSKLDALEEYRARAKAEREALDLLCDDYAKQVLKSHEIVVGDRLYMPDISEQIFEVRSGYTFTVHLDMTVFIRIGIVGQENEYKEVLSPEECVDAKALYTKLRFVQRLEGRALNE